MRKSLILVMALWYAGCCETLLAQTQPETKVVTKISHQAANSFYVGNKAPLRPNPYLELPLGAIKPQGLAEGNADTAEEWCQRTTG
jgi:hypothetical protein